MRLAFDAKRAFRNGTGLGQYSRNLLNAFFEYFPEHEYHLMTPKGGNVFDPPGTANVHTCVPQGWYKKLPALWRSSGVRHELKKRGVDLYHGLSHEMPVGLSRYGVKSVVTMHDLIFERYPHQYKLLDIIIYRRKFKYACNNADQLIAISHQTKQDLQEYYKVPEHKISVCYQSCDPAYQHTLAPEKLDAIKKKYNLPGNYLLSVGSVIDRKNLHMVCEALKILKDKDAAPPLVVIGSGKQYMAKVKEYIAKHQLHVIFLSEHNNGVESEDMPALYQAATATIYPSVFEGFGIPILESLWSKTPVITSNVSCMPETGGDAARYVDPMNAEDMANAINEVMSDTTLQEQMKELGLKQAEKFKPHECAAAVMNVYNKVL